MGQTAAAGHLDTVGTSSSTAGALCPETGVAGGSISLDTQREFVLLAMILCVHAYLFIYLDIGPFCASEAALERVG